MFIVGAGRSGTSAITRGVQALGVDLGHDFKRATRKNPTGFFEHAGLLNISKRVRRALGLRPDSLRLVGAEEWEQPALAQLRQSAADVIQKDFGRSPVWGFKYGRTLRILPFWEPVLRDLNLDVAFVVALRNPLSVARSRSRIDPRRGRQEKSDLEWLVGMVPWFRRMRGRPLAVVDYDLLMADPAVQLRRMAHLLALPLSTQVEAAIAGYSRSYLDSQMRHTQFDRSALQDDPRLNPLCRDAYLLLHRLATDELDPGAAEFWNQWSRIETAVETMAPVLSYIDGLERDYRRACLNPFNIVPALLYRLRVWLRS